LIVCIATLAVVAMHAASCKRSLLPVDLDVCIWLTGYVYIYEYP